MEKRLGKKIMIVGMVRCEIWDEGLGVKGKGEGRKIARRISKVGYGIRWGIW